MDVRLNQVITELEKTITLNNNREIEHAIDTFNKAILILDCSLVIKHTNRNVFKLICRKDEELFGKSFFTLLNRASFFEGIKLFDLIKNKRNYSKTLAIHYDSDNYQPIKCNFVYSKSDFYYCFLEKAKELEASEHEPPLNLEENSNLYISETFQALIRNSPAAVLVLDLNSYVLVWNKQAEKIYGLKSKEVVGKLLPTLTEESFQEHLEIRDKLLSGATIIDFDVQRKKSNGSVFWLNMSISPIKDANGKIFATMSIVTDITRRKLTEEKLKRTEILYRDVVETAQDLIWRCDTDCNLTYLNPAWEKVSGYKISEMIGKKFYDFQKKDQKTLLTEKFYSLLSGKSLRRFETVLIDNEKSEKYLLINAKKIIDESGNVSGICGTAYDITEKKAAEKSLRESEQMLRSIYENSTIGIYRTTPDGKIIMINEAGLKMLGYTSLREISERNLEKNGFEPSTPRSAFKKKIEKEGTISGFENAWKKKDGTTIFIRESSKAIKTIQVKQFFTTVPLKTLQRRNMLKMLCAKVKKGSNWLSRLEILVVGK